MTRFDDDGEEYADIKWVELGFGLVQTDYMYIMKCSKEGEVFTRGELNPYGNIEMSPCSGVMNYIQGLFEGLKAYRKRDGNILLFCLVQNAMRLQMDAERMCMQSPSIDQFIDDFKQTVHANKLWVPPPGKGSLYIRPLLLGTGPILGISPARECTFITYASPEGIAPLNLVIEETMHRANPCGTGGVKTITNYAPVSNYIIELILRRNLSFQGGDSCCLYLQSFKCMYAPSFQGYMNRVTQPSSKLVCQMNETIASAMDLMLVHLRNGISIIFLKSTFLGLGPTLVGFCEDTSKGKSSIISITLINLKSIPNYFLAQIFYGVWCFESRNGRYKCNFAGTWKSKGKS
ncbi:hypothetical protein MKX03_034584 [Papaver bracteatum]|nr:hypothetical protein MKX03_034584 [Papaver bracteatum]